MEGVKREEERTGKRVGGICDRQWGRNAGETHLIAEEGSWWQAVLGFTQILACSSEVGTRKLSQD